MTGNDYADHAQDLIKDYGEWYATPADELPTLLGRAQVLATLAVAEELRALRTDLQRTGKG